MLIRITIRTIRTTIVKKFFESMVKIKKFKISLLRDLSSNLLNLFRETTTITELIKLGELNLGGIAYY